MHFSASNRRATRGSQMFWYAAYTSSRHEKTVAEHLRQREVECFLPLYETVRRWNNGRHRVQLPLFPSYVFVRMEVRNKLRVLQVPGLVQLVTFQGAPAALPDAEIETLRSALAAGVMAQPYRYLSVGSKVEICTRPFAGNARNPVATSRAVSGCDFRRNDHAFDCRRSRCVGRSGC